MAAEWVIENNVIRNRVQLGYAKSLYIRRCRAGRGFGIVDVILLPDTGPHRIVLVEAKQSNSIDSQAKVIGQLLMYYAGMLHFGLRGLRYLREFASTQPKRARNLSPKLLKSLTGGITPPDAAWAAMQQGRKLNPRQIALLIALDGRPTVGLTKTLATHHDLDIGVVSVLGRDKIEVWRAP